MQELGLLAIGLLLGENSGVEKLLELGERVDAVSRAPGVGVLALLGALAPLLL